MWASREGPLLIVFLSISPYAFHSLTLHPFLSLPFEAIATPCISNDVGALGGTTEAAGGTNDDVAGGGGEDCAGWWCRALTAAQIVAGRRDGGLFVTTGGTGATIWWVLLCHELWNRLVYEVFLASISSLVAENIFFCRLGFHLLVIYAIDFGVFFCRHWWRRILSGNASWGVLCFSRVEQSLSGWKS